MWLVIFLLYWWAAVVNLAWEEQWQVNKLKPAVGSFAAVFILALLFGSGRAAFASTGDSLTISAIAPSSAQYLQAMQSSGNMQNIITGNMTPADLEIFQKGMAPLTEELLSQTETAAQNGAKIIFWAEGSTMILAEDEAGFQSQAQALSQQYGVYIGLAYAIIQPAGSKHHNKVVLVDPAGNIALEYLKTKLVPFAEDMYFEPGTGDVPVVDTPYGRLAMAICHDLDHHEFVQQLGEKEVDILLVPTGDWADIAQVHLNMMATRAIEQGLTIVRATRGGYSAVVAPTGEVLATKDNADAHFNGTLVNPPYPAVTSVLQAPAPQQGINTLYRTLGDGFALLNVLVLVGLVGMALYGRFVKTKE
jgi:apolipoprotein N-acyltransferase